MPLQADIDYRSIPSGDTVRLYIERGIPGGGFATALFENDLLGAFNKADLSNQRAMLAYAEFLYNEAPAESHGSPEKVSAWIKSGGLEGRERSET
jgi:hypothetical protein